MSSTFATSRLAVLMLASAAPSAAQTGWKAAQKELRGAVRALDVSAESGDRAVAAVRAVAGFDDAAAADALLAAVARLERRALEVTETRRKGLAREGGSGRLKRSRYELRYVADAAEEASRALLTMTDPSALGAILAALQKKSSSIPLWLRLRLAGRICELPEPTIGWGRRGFARGERDVALGLIRVAAALGTRAGAACGGWLVEQLEHANPDVRAAAADALGQIAWPGAIEPLIGRLEKEDGRLRERLLDALVVLTAQDPGSSAASWRAWLAAEGAPFLAGARALSEGDASARPRPAGGGTSAGTYFGIEQSGAGILYVFDNSQSMQAKLKRSAAGEGPTTGGAATTRWEACRQELRRALRGLSPDKRFNLVSFANKARCFAPTVLPATEANIERAIGWIDGLELEFQTNAFDALELAFQVAGRGVHDRYYESDVDTMFFLSDGAPTIAKLNAAGIVQDDSDRILRAVARWNALGRVRIHAIALGLQKRKKERNGKGRLWPYTFLARLAAEHGGELVLRR
ncbi:MAG: HEAT repeat domain-containing protein [Planctomycetota bacterium]